MKRREDLTSCIIVATLLLYGACVVSLSAADGEVTEDPIRVVMEIDDGGIGVRQSRLFKLASKLNLELFDLRKREAGEWVVTMDIQPRTIEGNWLQSRPADQRILINYAVQVTVHDRGREQLVFRQTYSWVGESRIHARRQAESTLRDMLFRIRNHTEKGEWN
jgi:hypothetical protein